MGKAFTEKNKDRIRASLLEKGREYFMRYGLKKTSVDELARAAGIAKGSFYRFFETKEALFLAVHEASEETLRADMMRRIEAAKGPSEKLRAFLKNSFAMLEHDPLMAAVFAPGEFEGLSVFMASPQFDEHYRQNIVFMQELLRRWQAEGIIRDLDTTVAGNLLTSVFFTFLQKETLGEEMYAKVTDMLIECLVSYLSTEGR